MRLTKVLKPSLIKKYFQYLRAKGTKESSIKRKQAALAKFIAFAQDTYGINKTTIKKATSPRARLSENLLLIREKMYPNFFTWYLPLLLLTLLGTAMGIAVYRQFFSNANSPLAYPSSLTAPARILSFQGRLTDDSDNPINSSTDFVFRLYTVETDGTPVWTSNTCNVTPDQDGIFSFRLGATSGSNACGPAIGEDVFTANNGVWLEVEVNSEVLDNRQPIASSAYALNAETLQGFPPASPATASTVPIIDSSGDLLIGASNPDIVSSSGTFTLTGEVLSLTSSGTDVGEGGITLQAADTSDASITLNPDGTGVVDMIFEGTAPDTGYGGFVNATNASLTSGSLYYGEVASNATGYNMLEFQAGETPSEKLVFQIADGLEGRLGINNSSPAQALDIVGNATASGNLTAGGQIQTGRFISAPTAIGEGALYYNPTDSNIYMYDGSQWVDLTDTGSTLSESEVEEYIYDSDNTLSGAWSVAFGANSGTFDLTGTGDFVIASSSTPFATFDSTGFFQLDNIKLDGNTISATNDSGLALYDNASNGIFIKDGGNVGIGTTDPNYPLSISAIDKTRALNIISTNSTTSSINGIYLDITQEDTIANPSTNGIFGYITSNDLTANATGISLNVTSSRDAYGTYMNVTSNTASVGPSSPNIIGGYYSVYGASQTRGLTIDSNAWGTASPAYGIEIYTRSNSGETYGLISNTYGATQDLSYAGYFDNSSTNITTNEINKYGVYITSTGNYTGSDGAATNNYGLFIATPTGADNNYTAVFEGGNVGIGTTAPDSELSVVGAIEVFGNAEGILLTNNIADATTFLSGGYPLNDVTSIGATTSGDYFMGSYRAGSGGSFGTSSLGSYEGWVGFSYDVNDPLGTGYGTGLRVYNTSFATINVGGAEVARFDYAGNVGIGTTAPAYSLDIAGNASASGNLMAGGQVQVGRFVSEPTTIGNGAIYFNESDGNLYVYDGAGWVDLTGGGSALNEAEIEAYIYDNDNTLAGAWSVAFGNNSGTFDLTGSGDFVIADNSAPFATFADDGTFTLDNIKLDGNTIAATNDSGLALYDNASNGIFIEDGGNVGIGTTDPATKLEIGIASGNTQVEALRLDTTSSAANMGTYLAFHGLYTADQARIVGFREGTSNLGNLSFWTRDDNTTISEKMRIEGGADGNVGIGTTDPGTILHIATPNQWNSTLKLEGTYNGSNETNIQLKRTLGANPIADWGTIGNIFFTSVDSGLNEQDYMWLQGGIADNTDLTEDGFFKFWLMKGGSSAEVFSLFPDETVFNDGSLDIDFRVESDDDENALFVEGSTGNVGIGTTDPRVKLEVNGYIYASRLADKDGTDWYIDPALAEANAVGAAIYGRVGIGTSNPQAGLEILKDSVDFIKASNSAGTASFIVNSEGNVGIGTTSPSGKLSLYDATGTDLNMQYGGDQRWWITADTASLLKIGGIGSTRPSTGAINIHSSGNVGIGTTNPGAKQHIYDGNLAIEDSSRAANTKKLQLMATNIGGSYGFGFKWRNDDWSLRSEAILFDQTGSVYFTGGDVGIGTITPETKLHVEGDITIGGTDLYFEDSTDGGDASLIRTIHFNNNDDLVFNDTLNQYKFSGDGVDYMVIDDGNVGIGTTNPGTKLTVVNADGEGIAALSGAAGNHTAIALGRAASEGRLGIAASGGQYATGSAAGDLILRVDSSSQKILFSAGTTPTMTLTSSGIGIGTTDTIGRIHSYGSGMGLYLNQATAGDLYIRFHVPSVRWWTMGPKTNGDFWFSNTSDHSGTVPLAIKKEGNVGIGTTSPNTKLEIYDLKPMLRLTDNDTGVDSGQVLGGIEFYNSDQSAMGNAVTARINAYAHDIYGRTGIDFYTSSSDPASLVRQLRIDAYGNTSITGTLTLGTYITGSYGNIARSTDEWLRLNQNSSGVADHTNGIYTPGGLRADGGLAAANYTLTPGEVRANLFRDGNSGTYYVDPGGTSVLNGLTLVGDISKTSGNPLILNSYADIYLDFDDDNNGTNYIYFRHNTTDAIFRFQEDAKAYADSGWGGSGWFTGAVDLAEVMPIKEGESLQGGDIVSQSNLDEKVEKTKKDYDDKILGIVSTAPGLGLGFSFEEGKEEQSIALVGRVPTKVTSITGRINHGDAITSSPIQGIGMKSIKAGSIVGKSLETTNHWNTQNCPVVTSIKNIPWPVDGFGKNPDKPCFRVPVSSFDKTVKDKLIAEYDLSPSDFIYVGKIMTFVNVSWYDPDVYLSDAGDIEINGIDENSFVVEKEGSVIDKIDLFSKLFVGEIKSGLTEATKIISDTLIATRIISEEKVISPIVETNEIAIGSETDKLEVKNTGQETIMEIADDGTTTHFGDLIVKNGQGEEVAKVDTQGNAEFNGKVTASEIETDSLIAREATFSTIYADDIIADGGSFKDIMADKIAAVRAELERIVSTGTATSSGDTVTGTSLYAQAQEWPISPDESATAQSLDDIEDLGITGRLSSNEVFVYESLIVDNLVLTQQSLSSLDGILMLQPQGVGKIDLLAGVMVVEDNGSVTVNGNLTITGSLAANEYRGIDGNFNINLAKDSQEAESGFGMLNVYGQDNQLVASVDETGNADFAGDLTASGSASFAKLNIESEEVAPVIAADSGFGELAASSAQISTNASAGSGSIAAGHTQIEILTDKVNSESLIYVTPTSDTLNQVLFIKQKGEGQFTVGIRQAVEEEIEFNWWVIN